MPKFFISCPLNYEKELSAEIKNFWFEMIDLDGQPTRAEFPELEVLQGGIELETSIHLGFQINLFSKLANRVLLRINKFEARYFDQFEKGLKKTELNAYLNPCDMSIKVESHKSRLNNEKNIIEAATNVLSQQKFKITNEASQALYIRIEKDRVMISLDTSGEHLHRRGYSSFRGEAPLRETLAAYVVAQLKKQVLLNDQLSLIDPFAGAGTLLFEASSSHLPNLERNYSWLHFKNCPKLFQSSTWKKNYRWFENVKTPDCQSYDIDEKSVQSLEKNKKDFSKVFPQCLLNLNSHIQDSHHLKIDRQNLKPHVWIVSNPPYGIRLDDDNAKSVFEKLIESVDGMVVIHPANWKFNAQKMKTVHTEDFNNQGLKLKLSTFIKNNGSSNAII